MDKEIVINKTESQSSFAFRWGKTGDEAKIYFDNWEELKIKLDIIKDAIRESQAIKDGVLGEN